MLSWNLYFFLWPLLLHLSLTPLDAAWRQRILEIFVCINEILPQSSLDYTILFYCEPALLQISKRPPPCWPPPGHSGRRHQPVRRREAAPARSAARGRRVPANGVAAPARPSQWRGGAGAAQPMGDGGAAGGKQRGRRGGAGGRRRRRSAQGARPRRLTALRRRAPRPSGPAPALHVRQLVPAWV